MTKTRFVMQVILASYFLTFLLTLVFGMPLGDILKNVLISGIFSLLISFAATYLTLATMYKNSSLPTKERGEYLHATAKWFAIVGMIFFLMALKESVGKGILWTTFSFLSVLTPIVTVKIFSLK